MTALLAFRYEITKAHPWAARFQALVTWSAAVFLLASLSVASVGVQEMPESSVGQQPEAPPVASSEGLQKVTRKGKASKYDVDRIGQRGIGEGVNLYSLEQERELGHELSEEVEMTTKLIADPVITDYVNRVGQRIVRHSDAQVPFTIKVIDSDEMSALALPGGYFYVNSGLILAADNEAELAGVMAHEIAHVAARHVTRAETRMQLFNIFSVALMYFGGPAGAALREALGLAAPVSFIKFSRNAEREADLLGLEYEYASGYDPQALVQFFEKLHTKEKQKHNFVARAFAHHPMTEDRIRRAQKEISTMLPAKDEYLVDTSEFQEVKSRLAEFMHEHAASENGRPVLHRRNSRDDSPAEEKGPTLRRPSNE